MTADASWAVVESQQQPQQQLPPGSHRHRPSLPWYAQPVAFLCGDENVNSWRWISLLRLCLKVFSVAAATTSSVALAVVCSALGTAFVWWGGAG